MSTRVWRRAGVVTMLAAQMLLAGCATMAGADPRDPWEPFNRRVTRFNEVVDTAVFEPVAKGYQTVVPDPVRVGVSNFFGNLNDVWSTVNNVLQLKPRESVESLMRVGINSTLGLFGVLDVASELKLERHREDFGQTLGHWGVATGPYLVLPMLGPSTLRDAAALPVDWRGDLLGNFEAQVAGPLSVLRLVDKRAAFLGSGRVLDAAALDKYTFIREAYLQRRRGAVPPPAASSEDERFDLPEPGTPEPAADPPSPQTVPDEAAPAQ